MARRGDDPKEARKGLEALRRRLAEAGPVRREPPPPAPSKPEPAPAIARPTPPEPDDPEAFDREMKAAGVGAIGPDRRRMASPPARPPSARASSPAPLEPNDARLSDEAMFDAAMASTRSSRASVPEGDLVGVPVLDLHGFSEGDALHEVRRFVELHRGARAIVVRIITGRGVHGGGVIRSAIHAWLDRAGAVAAWRSGRPAEGGDGIVIAQLKRRGAR